MNGPEGGRGPGEEGSARWSGAVLRTLLVALLVGGIAVQGSVDRSAQAATDRVFRQALLTYAAARSLDAAVSLAEGTELAVEPGGVGVTISAGEILEPLDDLVEQFSSLLLVSTTSLGLQSLLLRASAWPVLTLLLLAFLVGRIALAFWPDRFPERFAGVVRRGAILLAVARLAVPLYGLGTTLLFERYLQPGQEAAVVALEEASVDVRELDRLDEVDPDPGLRERVSRWFSGALDRLDVAERVEALRERVGQVVDQLLHLLVVFTLQTLVLPLVFLWVLGRVVTAVTRTGR